MPYFIYIMKLLIDIEDRLFNEVKRLTGAKKKRDAVIIPMKEYLLAQKRRSLAALIGDFEIGMTLADLKRQRRRWQKS